MPERIENASFDELYTWAERVVTATSLQDGFGMTAAARLRQEGKNRALKQFQKEGMAKLMARQLTLRFGELPESVLEQLHGASAEQLDAWAERLLTAPSLQAVFE